MFLPGSYIGFPRSFLLGSNRYLWPVTELMVLSLNNYFFRRLESLRNHDLSIVAFDVYHS